MSAWSDFISSSLSTQEIAQIVVTAFTVGITLSLLHAWLERRIDQQVLKKQRLEIIQQLVKAENAVIELRAQLTFYERQMALKNTSVPKQQFYGGGDGVPLNDILMVQPSSFQHIATTPAEKQNTEEKK